MAPLNSSSSRNYDGRVVFGATWDRGRRRALANLAAAGAAPVEQWNPPFCGDIDMRIAREGLVLSGNAYPPPRACAAVRIDPAQRPERYVLVTPVERVGIIVEDAPFVAVEMLVEGADDRKSAVSHQCRRWVCVDATHPLRFEKDATGGVKRYVRVRGGLWALVTPARAIDLLRFAK